jgi:hypothetical protein
MARPPSEKPSSVPVTTGLGAPTISRTFSIRRCPPQSEHPPVRLTQQHLNQMRLDAPSLAAFDTFVVKRRKP